MADSAAEKHPDWGKEETARLEQFSIPRKDWEQKGNSHSDYSSQESEGEIHEHSPRKKKRRGSLNEDTIEIDVDEQID